VYKDQTNVLPLLRKENESIFSDSSAPEHFDNLQNEDKNIENLLIEEDYFVILVTIGIMVQILIEIS